MVANFSFDDLLSELVAIAREAGRVVETIYKSGNFQTTYKADNSPVTRADIAANDIILKGLHRLTPSIPILSEESLDMLPNNHQQLERIWLVDPIDGTKEFIDQTGNFTVNIGLIEHGIPILGVVYAPAYQTVYYGAVSVGAWKQIKSQSPIKLAATKHDNGFVAAVSRSHQNMATKRFLATLPKHTKLAVGSSLKLCYVADGTVSLYPRLGPSMEWDTAAADAILRAAGGTMHEYKTNSPLRYNKSDLHNPFFVSFGKGVNI